MGWSSVAMKRAVRRTGVTTRLPGKVRWVQRENLLEEAGEALPVSHGRVSFVCQPQEIVAHRLGR